MHWIAPIEDHRDNAALDIRLWDAAARRAKLKKANTKGGNGHNYSERRGSPLGDRAYHAEGTLSLAAGARFDYLHNLLDAAGISAKVNVVTLDDEKHNPQLAGVSPKSYKLSTGTLLKEHRERVSDFPVSQGYDAFGRIWEYVLGKLATSEAQDEYYLSNTVRILTEIMEPYPRPLCAVATTHDQKTKMTNERVDLQAFDYVLSKVTDGFLFEKFAQDLLCQIVGIEFSPLGGVKDRGLDGIDHTWQQTTDDKTIYQISIEADPRAKVMRTVKKLKENGFKFTRLCYVTNREVRDPDKLMEEIWTKERIGLQIRDIAWLRGNVAKSEGTFRVYADFVRNHAHSLPQQSSNLLVTDFASDPRVFVFLRQQLDSKDEGTSLRDLLVDSLVLFGLEGTDPDREMLRSRAEIIAEISKVIKFPINQIEGYIDSRLAALSDKPRQINYHTKNQKYCLPYETRLRLDEQRIKDTALFEGFNTYSHERLEKHLKLQKIETSRPEFLLSQTLNQIFRKQGLDFADFVLNQKDPKVVETALPDVVHGVLDAAGVRPTTRTQVGLALLGTIREIIYRGTPTELDYLRKLARSYMVLFLVQCDPHVCNYFDSLASKLRVFVCNSIVVPALSEICVPKENRRFWNLLLEARNAGVKLYMNKVALDELVSHIRLAIKTYNEEYRGLEEHYSDERTLRYVRPILIRAYLYQKANGDSMKFDQFVYKFVSPQAKASIMAQEMITFLRDEFGIEYVDDGALGFRMDKEKCATLVTELVKLKRTAHQAENDARTVLTIYGLREKDNESGRAGIFGFRTWWLSMDTTTHRAVTTCFKDRRLVSCYLRPDFLLHYIALSARSSCASKVFDQMFPTLIGVSLAHHVTDEMSHGVHDAIKRHKDLSGARVKAVIGSLSTQLMTEAGSGKGKRLRHLLDEAFNNSGPEKLRHTLHSQRPKPR